MALPIPQSAQMAVPVNRQAARGGSAGKGKKREHRGEKTKQTMPFVWLHGRLGYWACRGSGRAWLGSGASSYACACGSTPCLCHAALSSGLFTVTLLFVRFATVPCTACLSVSFRRAQEQFAPNQHENRPCLGGGFCQVAYTDCHASYVGCHANMMRLGVWPCTMKRRCPSSSVDRAPLS